ncbi:TetR/AcrR family transcriptional regulator [Streptosporangium sp. NPDC000396]|uniref:TetR/AcrR family transcriptional regulator n=1 Tax=Streptosporangium sp. NPDC000396 TaxID=3366185 RepID=UPI0036A0F654
MGETDQNGLLALLWGTSREPTRGPKPTLTVERIARTAVEIADAEGIDAVSMQRVATAVGVTKMALYRYVAGKDQLVAVMVEEAWSDPPDLAPIAAGWRPRVEEFARRLEETWGRHPWLPWVTLGDRVMGPREAAWAECAITALADTPLTNQERMDAAFLIFGHIRNTQSTNTAGTQPWNAGNARPALERLLREHASRYPALIATLDSPAPGHADATGRRFGLTRILDGLQVLITDRSP